MDEWKQRLAEFMLRVARVGGELESILADYPSEGEKPDRKRMRADIVTVLKSFNTPEMKRLADLLRKLPAFDKRANELNGKTWLCHSISVWDDIRKSAEERRLGHPAVFPVELAKRLIECFTNDNQDTILDPFAGIGSTLVAAKELGKDGIGIELSQKFADIAIGRIGDAKIHVADSRNLCEYVPDESVDMVLTSPPYWNILLEKRTKYPKENANYGDTEGDLGKVDDYDEFLTELKAIFAQVYRVMKPNSYCCIIVMDIRKGDRLYPLHTDVSLFMEGIGFQLDDLIIWNRAHDYNHLYTLGYPTKFRINRVHEFILIFHKKSPC